ncbi:spore protease YyaC [Miltoncostaea oceani]|uniref:spore protease YyaC n=1 Tax=Miltoncostaea oceani TaxID=2843216 RepID=UPI003CCEED37
MPGGDSALSARLAQALGAQWEARCNGVLIACIGTDRSTGDSLGPITGDLLDRSAPAGVTVVGSIEDPLHALNLEGRLTASLATFKARPLVIAVDAALGDLRHTGGLFLTEGPLVPGSTVGKGLPGIGDISLSGVVGPLDEEPMLTLSSIRLHLVVQMARRIDSALRGALALSESDGQAAMSSKPSRRVSSLSGACSETNSRISGSRAWSAR